MTALVPMAGARYEPPAAAAVGATLRSRRAKADAAMRLLVREALDDHWSVALAAFRLRLMVGDDAGLLHYFRARLKKAESRRQTEVTKRALATVEVALAGCGTRYSSVPAFATDDCGRAHVPN
jgi:hypothetical protein